MLNSPALDVCAEHIHKKLHIGIVNYLHREWYENYLSIYQHYNSWHAKCAMLLTVTVQNVGDRWWADLIKIEHSNNQTPLDTTPANTAEISIVPPTPTWERWVLSNQQSKDGVAVLVTVWGYNHPPPNLPVVLDLPRTTFISRNRTEGKKGEFSGNGRQSFIFS